MELAMSTDEVAKSPMQNIRQFHKACRYRKTLASNYSSLHSGKGDKWKPTSPKAPLQHYLYTGALEANQEFLPSCKSCVYSPFGQKCI